MTQMKTDSIAGVAHDAYRALCVDLFLCTLTDTHTHTPEFLDTRVGRTTLLSHTHI